MDLSATHDRHGFLWIPKESEPASESPSPRSLDSLDIPRLHDRLVRLHRQTSQRLRSPHIGADDRQFLAGMEHALDQVLRLFSPDLARPEPSEPDPASERQILDTPRQPTSSGL